METDLDQRPSKRPKISEAIEPDATVRTSVLEHDHTKSLPVTTDSREIEVGITAYVSQDNKSFAAVLKKRYTDFLVNEILPNGQTVHLLDTAVPEKYQARKNRDKEIKPRQSDTAPPQEEVQATESKSDNSAIPLNQNDTCAPGEGNSDKAKNDAHWISEDDKQQLVKYLNADAVSQLLSLYQATYKHPERKPKEHPFVRTEFTNDRSERAEIHGCIRRVFSSRIESSTDQDGYLVLTAANPNSQQNRSRDLDRKSAMKPGKLSWAERGGDYLHFTLYKENKDTMEAISYLVRQMKVNAKTFQFAGTKDRRAVTAQRVSAHRMDAERLAAQNRSLRGSKLGDFEYLPHGLELGDLTGNEFTITLRECNFDGLDSSNIEANCQNARQLLENALADLNQKGYLNYFGMQRFGTFATRTDVVGLHILKGDFQAAVEAILAFDPETVTEADKAAIYANSFDTITRTERSEDANRSIALLIFKVTSNFHKANELLPRKFSAESSLIRHLHRQPTDFLGALMNIPRNLRLMYVHAYQSLVWNHAITQRMATYGSKVTEGDLVLVSEHRDKNQTIESTEATVDADGEIIINPAEHDRANNIDDAFERARHLTAEEALSGNYTIFDIVLPLPGYDILYPDHEIGPFYKSFMAAHGLDPTDMRRKQRDFSLSGSYRKILSRIGDGYSVDVRPYTRDEEQFVQTDLDILRQKGQAEHRSGPNEKVTTLTPTLVNGEQEAETGPQKVAAILRFQLGSSQYATMALRELSHGGVTAYVADFARKAGQN